jgi:hypothetical protein
MNKRIRIWVGLSGLCVFALGYFWNSKSNQPSRGPDGTSDVSPVVSHATEVGVTSDMQPLSVFGPASTSSGDLLREALNSTDPQERASALRRFLPAWVQSDAPGAANFAEGLSPGSGRDDALRIVAQNWGQANPEEAARWAATLTDETDRQAVLGAVCLGLAVNDPARAVHLASTLGLHDDGVLENLTQQWAAKDMSGAQGWALQQKSGEGRDQLIERIAFIRSQTDPSGAVNLISSGIVTGDAQLESILTVVHQWALRDHTGVTSWVAQLPSGEIRDRALNEIHGVESLQAK